MHIIHMEWLVKKAFRMLGNFYWKLTVGIIFALVWTAVAFVFAATVIGFPLAVQALRIARLGWKPFGRDVVLIGDRVVLSTLWVCTAGLFLGVAVIINAIASMLTLIGLPLAKQWLKIIKLTFFPFCGRID